MSTSAFEYVDSEGRSIRAVRRKAPSDYRELFDEVELDGTKSRDGAHDFKNDARYDGRFTQRYSDLRGIGFLLVAAALSPERLFWEDKPDVRAELAGGSIVFVEAAEVIETPSARFAGALQYVNVGLAREVQENTALGEKLETHSICLRASLREDERYDSKAILAEAIRFLDSTGFSALPEGERTAVGDEYPALQSIQLMVFHRTVEQAWIPHLQPDATSCGPVTSQVHTILEQKRALASTYVKRPLWLGLYITEPLTVAEFTIDALDGAQLNFSPFQTLLVGDQQNVLVYSLQ